MTHRRALERCHLTLRTLARRRPRPYLLHARRRAVRGLKHRQAGRPGRRPGDGCSGGGGRGPDRRRRRDGRCGAGAGRRRVAGAGGELHQMSPVQPGAGGPCSCAVPSSPGHDQSPGPRPRRSRLGRPTADLPRMRHVVAAAGARPASPGPRPWLDPTGDAAAASPLRGHARPAASDGATPPRGHHRGRRDRAAGPFTICRDLTRLSPRRTTAHSGSTSSRMRVEPGQDLATFPAVVLADLVERRPGSLAGVAIQRRLLDLQQCANFLGRQDLVSH